MLLMQEISTIDSAAAAIGYFRLVFQNRLISENAVDRVVPFLAGLPALL